ncbi:MAG: hypothetical protein H6R18_2355 [Proteobacteria bacterium]|nr:hypothetical protein [Pseudomonadota bacterium]
MIPADLASRLRLVAQDLPAPVQASTPARQVTDVLSDLVPGQRIMAEIQALLPNGMYRAVVAQRDITLALPFSAKAGDTLELEVLESEGKLTLAFVANKSAGTPSETKAGESVSTTLSKTGNLIGNLLNDIDQQGGQPKPASLNANQPLLAKFPDSAADLVPILKESLSRSGMFYEAHQARWVEGKLSTASLLQEPQGRLSQPTAQAISAGATSGIASPTSSPTILAPTAPGELPRSESPNVIHEAIPTDRKIAVSDAAAASQTTLSANKASDIETQHSLLGQSNTGAIGDGNIAPRSGPAIHPDLTPLVQQQLNALATQTYVWQGQVWPNQPMHWEITEEDSGSRTSEDEDGVRWQTRLKLDLPQLGGIDATLRLRPGGQLELSLLADSEHGKNTLTAAGIELDRAYAAAGLKLAGFTVSHDESPA